MTVFSVILYYLVRYTPAVTKAFFSFYHQTLRFV